jgi:hypothetical protein
MFYSLNLSAAQRECVRPIALGFRWMNSGIYISNSYVLEKKTQINYVGISKRSNHFQRDVLHIYYIQYFVVFVNNYVSFVYFGLNFGHENGRLRWKLRY